jgi:hypothetical protein
MAATCYLYNVGIVLNNLMAVAAPPVSKRYTYLLKNKNSCDRGLTKAVIFLINPESGCGQG